MRDKIFKTFRHILEERKIIYDENLIIVEEADDNEEYEEVNLIVNCLL